MKQCKHVTALARGEDTSKGEKIVCEYIFEPPSLLNVKGAVSCPLTARLERSILTA